MLWECWDYTVVDRYCTLHVWRLPSRLVFAHEFFLSPAAIWILNPVSQPSSSYQHCSSVQRRWLRSPCHTSIECGQQSDQRHQPTKQSLALHRILYWGSYGQLSCSLWYPSMYDKPHLWLPTHHWQTQTCFREPIIWPILLSYHLAYPTIA